MLKLYMHTLTLLSFVSYCHAMKYAWIPAISSNISLIPDPKWHFFVQSGIETQSIVQNVTAAHPVLRGCTANRVYETFLRKGQPRTEILTIFQEKRGEFLVNLTLNGSDLFVNGKFYVKTRWTIMEKYTEIYLDKHPKRTEIWATFERAGDIKFMPPEYEWVYINVDGAPCSEVKIKVVDGYAELLISRTNWAFPTEPYEDVLYSPTTTSAITTTDPITIESEFDKNPTSSNKKKIQKASMITGLICAAIAILVLIAAALLSFLGFRLGRWHARKQALKNEHNKVQESCATTTPDNADNKATEAAITLNLSSNLRQSTEPNVTPKNASSYVVRLTPVPKPPKMKDASDKKNEIVTEE